MSSRHFSIKGKSFLVIKLLLGSSMNKSFTAQGPRLLGSWVQFCIINVLCNDWDMPILQINHLNMTGSLKQLILGYLLLELNVLALTILVTGSLERQTQRDSPNWSVGSYIGNVVYQADHTWISPILYSSWSATDCQCCWHWFPESLWPIALWYLGTSSRITNNLGVICSAGQ